MLDSLIPKLKRHCLKGMKFQVLMGSHVSFGLVVHECIENKTN